MKSNQQVAPLSKVTALDPAFLQELKQERVADLVNVTQAASTILATVGEQLDQDSWTTVAAGLSLALAAAARRVEKHPGGLTDA